jgi:hypothetical protein
MERQASTEVKRIVTLESNPGTTITRGTTLPASFLGLAGSASVLEKGEPGLSAPVEPRLRDALAALDAASAEAMRTPGKGRGGVAVDDRAF